MKLAIAALALTLATTAPACVMGSFTVFATKNKYKGDFGGLAAADAICNQEAQDAGLLGDYVAWLSDSKTNAGDRIDSFEGAFALPDGTIVANNLEDLVNGKIRHWIDQEADGTVITSTTERVWTGTSEYGRGNGNDVHCKDWTDGERGNAWYGSIDDQSQPRYWTRRGALWCAYTARLYCIQQPTDYFPFKARISSADGDLCIDIPRRNMVNGQDLIMWKCHGEDNQLWRMDAQGRIRSKQNPNFCLDPQGPNTADNTPVQIWECEEDYLPQKWKLTAEKEIRSLWTPDKCIDVFQNGNDNANKVVMFHCTPQWNV